MQKPTPAPVAYASGFSNQRALTIGHLVGSLDDSILEGPLDFG